MDEDKGSVNTLAPLTVVNTRGFDLPQTGSNGTWMFPVIGGAFMIPAAVVIFLLRKKKSPRNHSATSPMPMPAADYGSMAVLWCPS